LATQQVGNLRYVKNGSAPAHTCTAIFNVAAKFFDSFPWNIRAIFKAMSADTKTSFKRVSFRLLCGLVSTVIVLYALVCVGYAMFQRRIIYTPPHRTAEQVDESAKLAGLKRWDDASGQAIGMERLSPVQPAAGRVLLVYGQGSWSVGCAHYADEIQSAAPLDFYILEYPGYADRAGSPSERNFFDAADEALRTLGTNGPVYVLGESLGTGVAAYLAGAHPGKIAGLILLSPYNCLTDVAQYRKPFLPAWLLLADRFPSADYLRSYHGPVGIMVDGRDWIVPERFGKRLYDQYDGPKQLWRFADGGHISIAQPKAKFWRQVMDFWRSNQVSVHVAGN
jgi:pimeloyl-ACP methyl ester carboxylesterase